MRLSKRCRRGYKSKARGWQMRVERKRSAPKGGKDVKVREERSEGRSLWEGMGGKQ